MDVRWHYLEAGRTVGPVSATDISRRMDAMRDQPVYVWAEGMTEWSDARALPEFSAAPASAKHETLAARARHEFVNYLSVSAYLFVWFSALLFYKSTILGSVGIAFAPFGFAAVKALILGKFMLVLEAVRIGDQRGGNRPMIAGIVWKALIFTVLLFLLSVIEELVMGYVHGREMKEALHEIGGGTLPQAGATAILLFLVLVPYLAFQRLARTYGDLHHVLLSRGEPNARGE